MKKNRILFYAIVFLAPLATLEIAAKSISIVFDNQSGKTIKAGPDTTMQEIPNKTSKTITFPDGEYIAWQYADRALVRIYVGGATANTIKLGASLNRIVVRVLPQGAKIMPSLPGSKTIEITKPAAETGLNI